MLDRICLVIICLLPFLLIFLITDLVCSRSRECQKKEFDQIKKLIEDHVTLQSEAFLSSKAMISEAFTPTAQEVDWRDT